MIPIGAKTIMKNRLLPISLSIESLITIVGLTASQITLPQVSIAQEILLSQHSAKPLAKELQGKPVVVDIYATWCPGCKNIAPTLSLLQQQYQGKVHFVKLDVTDRNTTQAAEKKAKQLGLAEFLSTHKAETSLVAIINPATGEVLKQFRNNPNQADYKAILDQSIAEMKK